MENDPRVKVKLFQVSADQVVRNGSVSTLAEIMDGIAPLVGARRAAVQARSQAKMAQVLKATAALLALTALPAEAARGPDAISDVAEKVIDAVVNISTSQVVDVKGAMPQTTA